MEKNTDETLIKNDTSKSFFLDSGLPRDASCKSQQEKIIKQEKKNNLTRKRILYLKMCFLVELFLILFSYSSC